MHVFKYSKRRGTVAEKMPNQIDGNIKEERSNKLIELSNKNENEYNESLYWKRSKCTFLKNMKMAILEVIQQII